MAMTVAARLAAGSTALLAIVSVHAVQLPHETRAVPHMRMGSDGPAYDSAWVSNNRRHLGRLLFMDESLSRDSSMSCATCHLPTRAFADTAETAFGIGLRSRRRNTPSLLNVAVHRTTFDWDGRARTIRDQIAGVFSLEGDMGIDTSELAQRVARANDLAPYFLELNGRRSTATDVLDALADFIASLVIDESSFTLRYLSGGQVALPDDVLRGWQLFRSGTLGCAGCHVPLPDPSGRPVLLFRDDRFHNLGVGFDHGRMADAGRYLVSRRLNDRGAFATPSLLNVSLTAPYMHDGSIATLDSVIAFYARGGIANPWRDRALKPFSITPDEASDLIAFLTSLTTAWLADSVSVSRRLLDTRWIERRASSRTQPTWRDR